MATRQPAAKAKPATKAAAKPTKKSTSTALTVWEQEMAEAAVAQGASENSSGGHKAISLRGGILAIDDNAVDGNELQVVVIAACYENQYYTGDFDPDRPASPVCYAFGKNEDEMAPHEEAPDKQADLCAGCWANEWNTADKGKGKACKNVRRLLCVTPDALESADAMAEAEMRMLKLPVTSVKNWTAYVKQTLAEDIKRPSWGVVTNIRLVPDAKSQFKVQFKFDELVAFDQDLYDAMQKKVKEAEANIGSAYPVFEEEEKPAPKGRRTIPIKAAPAAKGKPAAKAAPAKAAPAKRGGKY